MLRPTDRQVETLPCGESPGCGCRHEVVEVDDRALRAVCRCEAEECPPASVEPLEVVVFELDVARLCRALAGALGLGALAPGPVPGTVRSWRVGTVGASQRPVVLAIVPGEALLLTEIGNLRVAVPEPFLLLTPAGLHCTPRVEAALRQHGGIHLALARHLAADTAGRLKCVQAPTAVLADWERRLGQKDAAAGAVMRIDRNLEAVARGQYELRRENEELKQLQAEGYLKFALRVDAEDFRAFAVIMALGNRKAAADFLEVPHRSFYDRVDLWARRGKEYHRMARAVEWRKNVGRKRSVPLGDAVQFGDGGEALENPETMKEALARLRDNELDSRDYPALLGGDSGRLGEVGREELAGDKEGVDGDHQGGIAAVISATV